MSMDRSYNAVTGRKSQIIRDAIGVDYSKYEKEGIAFDYEAMMNDTGYTLETITVTDKNGDKVKLTEKSGKYTFTMPASKVTVTGTFVEIEQPMVNPFIDVKESDYFYNAVMWAVKSGVTKGTSATTFSPNAPCTRAQMVTFLWRASGSPKPVTDVCPFTDVNMDSYYGKAVLWAVETGITNGTSETTFSPEADCTRAQMVTFLYLFFVK